MPENPFMLLLLPRWKLPDTRLSRMRFGELEGAQECQSVGWTTAPGTDTKTDASAGDAVTDTPLSGQ